MIFVMQTFLEHKINAMPVINEHGEFVGLLLANQIQRKLDLAAK